MATQLSVFARFSSSRFEPELTNYTPISSLRPHLRVLGRPYTSPHSLSAATVSFSGSEATLRRSRPRRVCRNLTFSSAASMVFSGNPVVSDLVATAFSGGIALSLLRLWAETAKRGLFDQEACACEHWASFHALLATIQFWSSRSSSSSSYSWHQYNKDASSRPWSMEGRGYCQVNEQIWRPQVILVPCFRELLKGPLYYASAITLACAIYWRTSPVAIAAICNLCAGDGLADIVGRRFGSQKIPYNRNKSIAGSIAMATAGFMASIGFMYYFALFGYVQESWEMALRFLIVSIATALVESHPLSTELDDNLTVPLTSVLVGNMVF
ncbi:probable phytol kinase 2, chloroplastic isoform X1 [Actinidia eriantha]|uniref:probable phytol kinase 2, chloroplastic isoform X1 n=1 Tax=Actinidia eriantha TaxID=165200 RepID=UPI00258B2808|nr:probable phytol kinase 2, chloroplastic isoform X1 [Actinidia eriantha]